MDVCTSILASGDKIAGPVGTGETPFSAPERRKSDGGNQKAVVTTQLVQRQADTSIGGSHSTRRNAVIRHQTTNVQEPAGPPAAAGIDGHGH